MTNVEISTPNSLIRFRAKELSDLVTNLLKEVNRYEAPSLLNAKPLVLYFGSDEDRQGFADFVKANMRNVKTIKLK